ADQDRVPIGAERDGVDGLLVRPGLSERLSRSGVPEADGSVLAAGDDELAIGTACGGENSAATFQRQSDAGALVDGRGPQPRLAIAAPGEDVLAIGAVRHDPDRRLVNQRDAESLTRWHLPESRRAVVAASQRSASIGAEHHAVDRELMDQGI